METLKQKLDRTEKSRRFAWSAYFNTKAMAENLSDLSIELEKELGLAKELGKIEIPKHISNMIIELSKKANELISCPICLDNVTECENTKLTKCGHVFHTECFKEVKDNRCPVCRKRIN